MAKDNNSVNIEWSNPPPPPILPVYKTKRRQLGGGNVSHLKKVQKIEDDLKDFSRKIIGEMKSNKNSFVFNYRYLYPILQDGPNCGLAALSMVTSCKKEILKLDDIFKYTKSRGYSNNGEMFSVKYMAEIAKTLIGCDIEILDNGLESKDYILTQIFGGALLLIPYDADFNHSPCKRKGHKAHWAVVSGLILEGIPPPSSIGKQEEIQRKFNCIHYLPNEDKFILRNICKAYNPDKVYVLARQGKSIHPAVWKYSDLKDSNENLIEFDPSRAESDLSYILPPEGVEGGLRGKALLLKGFEPVNEDDIVNYVNVFKTFL